MSRQSIRRPPEIHKLLQGLGLGLWCLTPFSTPFSTMFQLYRIFASQGLRSALLIFTLGIIRRIFEVTRWLFICNAASGSCNQ